MSKTTPTDESLLEEALTPIVNKLIDTNYETSQDKLASHMAPLIGNAIREQIKSQKDDVVDALYPVMGNMIHRYVSKTFEQLIEQINSKIQNGLSFTALKRKLTAKMHGVSETEFLLNENAYSNISALLLIHKETGMLLAHSQNPNYPLSEPEMIASMMSAIRSFVNEWVEQSNSHQELGEIDYGGNKIIIETSGYSYLAVIVEGAAYPSTYEKIQKTLEYIVHNYGSQIRNFQGDLSTFPNIEIYREMSTLLSSEEQEQKSKKLHPILFLVPLLVLCLGIYGYYEHYKTDKLLTEINTALYQTPQLTTYRLKASLEDEKIILQGEVPFAYHKKLATTISQKLENEYKIQNKIIVLNAFKDPMQTSANIAYLLAGLNTNTGIHLNYSYDFTTLTLQGSVWDKQRKESVLSEFAKLQGIQSIKDTIAIQAPTLKTRIYFGKTLTTLTPASQTKLIEAIRVLKNLNNDITISISSYSDQIGSPQHNKELSLERIQNVVAYLQNQGNIKNKVHTYIYDTPPKGINASSEPQKARCIIIDYAKKETHVRL